MLKTYLKDLVNAGYLKITHQKSNRGYTASKLTICLPQKFVEELEASPDRNRAKKISRCGTVAKEGMSSQVMVGNPAKGGSKTRPSTYSFNKELKHNNVDRDLASDEAQKKLRVKFKFFCCCF